VIATAAAATSIAAAAIAQAPATFNRVSKFPVFLNTSVETTTSAEIVAATEDGNTLVYSDSPGKTVGFIDITDPAQPLPGGSLSIDGEPTCVAILGQTALVAVNTSPSFVMPSGLLLVIDVPSRAILRTIPLGGQPDSLAISPDRQFAAIAIENERDESLGNGAPPQLPAGFLTIVDLVGGEAGASGWTTRDVELLGLPILYPTDPEPEFVHINDRNEAALSLQENNALAIIDLATGTVRQAFTAGAVDLVGIDVLRNDLIQQVATQFGRLREPDGVAWIDDAVFATANEGDLSGGSRGFTLFNSNGVVLFESGSSFDRLAATIGHYPERRSNSKGTEPETVVFETYGVDAEEQDLLFVASERGSFIGVYEISAPECPGDVNEDGVVGSIDLAEILASWGYCQGCPADISGDDLVDVYDLCIVLADWGTCVVEVELLQVLPAGVSPEGIVAIPQRDLLAVASEVDARADGVRAVVTIYRKESPTYPQVVSTNLPDGRPLPWAALSGLATAEASDLVYTIYDSFFKKSRVFTMDVSNEPAVITGEVPLVDSGGVLLAALQAIKAELPGTPSFNPAFFIDAQGNVNLDPEGVAVAAEGGWWIASEGLGNLVNGVSNPSNQPFTSPNLLVKVAPDGGIMQVLAPPIEVTRNQLRFGFEGVASTIEDGAEVLYACWQREWTAAGDPLQHVRIGRCDVATGTWTFAYYPIEPVASPNGGWVGLSEITPLGGGRFGLIERDNQSNTDARIKLLTSFSVEGVEFRPAGDAPNFPVLAKVIERDMIAEGDFQADVILEKIEGCTVLPNGVTLVVTDNDGVNGSSGETQLIRIEPSKP